jgi:hypothetical protein
MAKATKAKTKTKRRSMTEIANNLYRSKQPTGDVARAVQVENRARGSVSPLGGQAVNPGALALGPLAMLAGKGRRK